MSGIAEKLFIHLHVCPGALGGKVFGFLVLFAFVVGFATISTCGFFLRFDLVRTR